MTTPVDEEVDATRVTWLRRAIWGVLGAGVLAFLVQGAGAPPDPYLVPVTDTSTSTTARLGSRSDAGQGAAPLPSSTSTVLSAESAPPATSSTTTASSTTAEPSVTAALPVEEPSTTSTTSARRPLPGFRQTTFQITDAEGDAFAGVAMLAADPTSRRQGLMGQRDLRGYDAMVFRFDQPSTGTFFMRNTLLPLSIAFFDRSGRFVSATDMEPCPDEVADCPSHSAARPYLHAVEVIQGDLPRLGIGPGSVLSFPAP